MSLGKKIIVENILYASDWGFPLEIEDVKQIVKSILNRAGQKKKHYLIYLEKFGTQSIFIDTVIN